jgi:hypothetical protein
MGYDLEEVESRKNQEITRQLEASKKQQISQARIAAEMQMVQQITQQRIAGEVQQQQGAPLPGQPMAQLPAGAPSNTTLHPESGIPQNVPKDMQMSVDATAIDGQTGNSVLYEAKRVASSINKLPSPVDRYSALNRLASTNPKLYGMVLRIMNDRKTTRDPLSSLQMPLPDNKPPRRTPDKQLV